MYGSFLLQFVVGQPPFCFWLTGLYGEPTASLEIVEVLYHNIKAKVKCKEVHDLGALIFDGKAFMDSYLFNVNFIELFLLFLFLFYIQYLIYSITMYC